MNDLLTKIRKKSRIIDLTKISDSDKNELKEALESLKKTFILSPETQDQIEQEINKSCLR